MGRARVAPAATGAAQTTTTEVQPTRIRQRAARDGEHESANAAPMNMKRMRGRGGGGGYRQGGGAGPGGGGYRQQAGGGGGNQGGGGGGYPTNRNHVFDSSGPDMRMRGTAQQLFEKYLQLGRDATGSGDRVMAEGYFQHAEHYFRILNAMTQQVQHGGGGGAGHGGYGGGGHGGGPGPQGQRRWQNGPETPEQIAEDDEAAAAGGAPVGEAVVVSGRGAPNGGHAAGANGNGAAGDDNGPDATGEGRPGTVQ